METLTLLETKVLMAIYNSDYQAASGEGVINAPVWYIEESDVDMKPGQLSGALSSCVKKCFIGIDHNDTTLWLTREGYDKIKSLI